MKKPKYVELLFPHSGFCSGSLYDITWTQIPVANSTLVGGIKQKGKDANEGPFQPFHAQPFWLSAKAVAFNEKQAGKHHL